MTTRSGTIIAAALAASLLAACSGNATPGSAKTPAKNSSSSAPRTGPVTVDNCGTPVSLAKTPTKTFTIGIAAVALLDAAGASDRIVARSAEFGAPLPSGLTTPPTSARVVDPQDPTAEHILSSGADIVVGYGLFNAKPEQLPGLPVLTTLGDCTHANGPSAAGKVTFATAADDIRRLGRVFATSAVADARAADLEKKAAALKAASPGKGAKAAWVYYFSPTEPLSAYGGTGMPQSVLATAGLSNVFADQKSYLQTNVDSLLKVDPDWIVLSHGAYGESPEQARAKFLAEPGAQALRAVKQGHVAIVPASSADASPLAIRGAQALADQLKG